jgi:hypothetical protein
MKRKPGSGELFWEKAMTSNSARAIGLSSQRGSEGQRGAIRDLPESERPLSEQFRIIAKEWVELDGAARLLEECKTATLSTMMRRLGNVPAAHAERDVKSSPEWMDYLKKMVETRTAANLKKVQLKYIELKHSEWQSAEANARHERRL